MKKLWLIIQREYLTRVRKRSFILTTLLTPLVFGLFIIVVGFITSYQGDAAKHILVSDSSKVLSQTMKDDKKLYFTFSDASLESLKADFDPKKYDGILLIPEIKDLATKKLTVFYYSDEQLGLDIRSSIEAKIAEKIREYKIFALRLDEKQLATLDTRVDIDPEPLKAQGDDSSSMTNAIAAALGGFMGVLMYMIMFVYGGMVMQSVMEEKTSRVVEIMIQSVRPAQLMFGKIIGVGLVGLTQLAIWVVLIPLIRVAVGLFFGMDSKMDLAANMNAADLNPDDVKLMTSQIMHELGNVSWSLVLPCFLLYFVGGYVLYASLFAAIGSVRGEDLGEGQSLMIIVTTPILLAFYIMFVAVRAPQSNLAIWASIFPLFSPIVMPARLAFHPPAWQILLSLASLAVACYGFVWLSGRIYRIGILMYGKKATLKELSKWIFYKE